jgi:hypothetical protein
MLSYMGSGGFMMNFTNGELIFLIYTHILFLVVPGLGYLAYEWAEGRKATGVRPHVEIQPISGGTIDHPHAA